MGGIPQFRLPCIKYSFIIKEKENKNKIISPKGCSIIKDFYNIEEKQKKTIVDQYMDIIYPINSIKKCLQINPTLKLKMRKFYKHLRESLSNGRNKTLKTVKNYEKNDDVKTKTENSKSINNEDIKPQNLKFIFNRNINKKDVIKSINKTYNYIPKEENKKNILLGQNVNKPNINQIDASGKLNNYNYPISNANTIDFCHSLISKNKTKISTQLLSSKSNSNNILNNIRNRKVFNSIYLSNFDNNKKINENSQSKIKNNNINQTNNDILKQKNVKIKHRTLKYSNSIKNIIYKRKRKNGLIQLNKLNIIYSENDEQFYRKYDKYRKNKILRGLCLTHINSSPKVVLNELNQKINLIRNKVGVVKSIVDKTFPKVLADISSIKKDYIISQEKEGYNSPYIEKLNKMKKIEENMNLFISSPIEILSKTKTV